MSIVSDVQRNAESDPELGDPTQIALALSGGGFRATLFHLGSLLRLNEMGYLSRLHRVVSVSGGSILAAFLGLCWPKLHFDAAGVADNFQGTVFDPIRAFCSRNVDLWSFTKGVATPWRLRRPGNLLTDAYARHLLGNATLQDLPDTPEFTLVATELHSAAMFTFSKRLVGCYTVGYLRGTPTIRLADCVAASSAFPPIFSPFGLRVAEPFLGGVSLDGSLDEPPMVARDIVFLGDGGTIDNSGFEVLRRFRGALLISDAGKRVRPITRSWLSETWVALALRALEIANGAADSLRRREILQSLMHGHGGAYWSIARPFDFNFGAANSLFYSRDVVRRLSAVRTRLNRFKPREQKELINLGYAMTDTAMRSHVARDHPSPNGLPFADCPIGNR